MKRSERQWSAIFFWIMLLIPLMLVSNVQPVAAGTVYYVAMTGNDLYPGTAAQPWRTIQKAANTLVAGDTVYIKAGTYTERVQPQHSGSSGAYITYAADSGATVTIDGSGVSLPSNLDGLVSISAKQYIKFSNLRVTNSQGAGIRVNNSSNIVVDHNYTFNTVSSGIGVWQSDNITVDNNEIVLANNGGTQENLTIAVTTNFEVKNNNIHDGGPGPNGGESLDIKDGSANGKVYGNRVHNNSYKLGIYVDAWDKYTHNIEIFQNTVYANTDYGMSIGSESGGLLENVSVYNNLIYANRGYGLTIRPDGPAATHPLKDITIINNTIYNNGYDWGGGIHVTNPYIQNVVIRNNIVSQNREFQIFVGSSVPPAQLTIDHNLIDGYRGYSGEVYGANYVTGNPMFYDPAYGDFHLMPSSPVRGAGSSLGAPITDFDGVARPQGSNPDIGAFQYVFVAVTPRLYLPLVSR